MSYSLYIDCSTPSLSVTLADSKQVICSASCVRLRSHNEELLSCIDEVLDGAGISSVESIERIIYGNGPGSFTGLRIGLSIVKGLFCAHNMLNVLTFDSLWGYCPSELVAGKRMLACSSAGREEFFVACYGVDKESLIMEKPTDIWSGSQLKSFIMDNPEIDYFTTLEDGERVPLPERFETFAATLIAERLACLHLRGVLPAADRRATLEEIVQLEPLYLRKVAARKPSDRQVPGGC